MATTPNITVTGNVYYISIAVDTTSATDTIQIWKMIAGVPTKLSNALTMTGPVSAHYNGTFTDYNIASGVSYTYFARAVDGSAGTADSATGQVSTTLSQGFLHSIVKEANTNAAAGTAVLDLISHSRTYTLAGNQYQTAGANVPTMGISAIEQIGVDFIITIPIGNDTNRATIRSMITGRTYCCYRDTRGNRFFGRLGYDERYEAMFTDLTVRFQTLDFTEAVA